MLGVFVSELPDIRKIAAAFHQRASDYDQYVAVQKRVVANLVRHIESESGASPESILDVGSGTGSLLSRLHSIYPSAGLYGVDLAYNMCLRASERLGEHCLVVNGDAEHLPLAGGLFDLVVSTSALQWVGDLSRALSEMRRVMKPGGTLSVAFFCEGTLCELQRCYREVVGASGGGSSDRADRLHQFRSVENVKLVLGGMDFDQIVLNSEIETDWYDDLQSLLRSIKNIGAGTVAGGGGRGLGWRGILSETSRLYREYYGQNGRIPVSYNILYLHARIAKS